MIALPLNRIRAGFRIQIIAVSQFHLIRKVAA